MTYRLANQKTVSTVRSGVLESRYGQFKVTAYQDTIHQRVHLALTVGDIRAITLRWCGCTYGGISRPDRDDNRGPCVLVV